MQESTVQSVLLKGLEILLAVPILTATWAVAIKISDIGLGLPFLLCAVGLSLITVFPFFYGVCHVNSLPQLSYFAIGIVIWKLKA